jgi:hypothetical protein
MTARNDFSRRVQILLAERSGYRCSAPLCRAQTIGPGATAVSTVSVGVAAHITAAAAGGPRFDKSLTPDQRASIDNGIWLCQTHARQIDVDTDNHPVEILRGWRADAVKQAAISIGKPAHTVEPVNVRSAREVIVRASRLPDMIVSLLEDIAGLPNSTIENTYPGVEYQQGRQKLQREHAQAVRALKRDVEDALACVAASPALRDLAGELFASEAVVRGQVLEARVPRHAVVSSTPDWQEFEALAEQTRRQLE